MDFSHSEADEVFRTELTDWLDEHLPKFLAEWSEDEDPADDSADGDPADPGSGGVMGQMERRRAWQRKLNEGRWAAISWPAEWGGRDATVAQNVIYSETMARYRTPGIYNTNGLWQIGPMIIRWGTDEQRQRWIPNILDAQDHWCQGFSEPEAGSDLANLRTVAVRDGDDYVINGEKTWTSSAHIARWGLFLVRTDPDAIPEGRKHDGITALIIDLGAPGITVTPIRDIAGEEMFCSVVFEDARVPVDYRLGGEGEGWLVAMGTLGSERASSTPSCSTTGRSPRSSATRRTGRRCRSRSSSGATSRRHWRSWRWTCSARTPSTARARSTGSTGVPGTACTCSSATPP
jgi:alkylation response protein AidB-like acyl-CoA dehydrogenase